MALYNIPFQPIWGTTATSFNSTLGNATTGYALEATSTGRYWRGGGADRTVRVNSVASAAFYASFGTASTTTTAAVGDSMLCNGGVETVIPVLPTQKYISFASSTDVVVNVTLGYGG